MRRNKPWTSWVRDWAWHGDLACTIDSTPPSFKSCKYGRKSPHSKMLLNCVRTVKLFPIRSITRTPTLSHYDTDAILKIKNWYDEYQQTKSERAKIRVHEYRDSCTKLRPISARQLLATSRRLPAVVCQPPVGWLTEGCAPRGRWLIGFVRPSRTTGDAFNNKLPL